MIVRCFALLLLFIAMGAQAGAPRTFSEAKKVAWKLYAPQSTEFYCGCKYTGNKVDLKACGYVPRKNAKRASRIEWERLLEEIDENDNVTLAYRDDGGVQIFWVVPKED